MGLTFIGETANDPATGLTLPSNYRINVNTTITSVSSFGGTAYGTYSIFVDANNNGLFDDGTVASSGIATINANFTISGTLTPTAGPNSSQAVDLDTRYSFAPLSLTFAGFFFGNAFDQGGSLQIRQTAVASAPVPEPASLAALGLGGLALLRRRRARK